MLKGKLDFVCKDVGDEGFVVGAILPLHLHQQLVIHAVLLLLLPACSSLSPFYTLNFLEVAVAYISETADLKFEILPINLNSLPNYY